jgi:hypothetical protein
MRVETCIDIVNIHSHGDFLERKLDKCCAIQIITLNRVKGLLCGGRSVDSGSRFAVGPNNPNLRKKFDFQSRTRPWLPDRRCNKDMSLYKPKLLTSISYLPPLRMSLKLA